MNTVQRTDGRERYTNAQIDIGKASHMTKPPSSVRRSDRAHRNRDELILLILVRDIPLQGINTRLRALLGIKERGILSGLGLNQQEVAIPDELASNL